MGIANMRSQHHRFIPLFWVLVSLLCSACAAEDEQDLCIRSLDGETHEFRVELVDTPEARRQGLMHRTKLADDQGMLFDFESTQPISMWMKNTPLSLDMLFIAESGRILRIERDTTPFSLRSIHSGRPARAVLEVLGGTTETLGIRVGDHVLHPVFDTHCD